MKKIGYKGSGQDLQEEAIKEVNNLLSMFASDLDVATEQEIEIMRSILKSASREYVKQLRNLI